MPHILPAQTLVLLQESKRLLSTVLSIQPGVVHPAGTASGGDQVAQLVASILADLPAVLSKEDASVARDPFAPLSTGDLPLSVKSAAPLTLTRQL